LTNAHNGIASAQGHWQKNFQEEATKKKIKNRKKDRKNSTTKPLPEVGQRKKKKKDRK